MNRYPSDRLTYDRLKNQLTNELQKINRDSYNNYLASLDTRDGSLYRTTRRLTRQKDCNYPLKLPDETYTRTDAEKANSFALHLSQVFTPHPSPDLTDQLTFTHQQPTLPHYPGPRFVTPSEVKFLISRLKKNKAPGYDLLTDRILKHLPRKALVLLTYIFNAIFRIGYFPMQWKFAVIIMIPKPFKPLNSPSSYRPISLLSILSKLFEKILLNRCFPFFESAIPIHQFGFRSHHSTIHQIHRICDQISTALEKREYCTGAFLDVSQAFDRVWTYGLLHKLRQTLPHELYIILESYLTDRHYVVRQGNDYSDYYRTEAGVPQGGVLAPILYLLYTADIPTTDSTTFASYADDICILATDTNPVTVTDKIQRHLLLLEPWLRKWKIKINETKSTHTTFTLRKQLCPSLHLNGRLIPQTTETKYLGLVLDKRLTYRPHLKTRRTALDYRLKQLRGILHRNSKLDLRNKLLTYKTILRPIWTYGIQLWGCAKPSNLKLIQTFQSKYLRQATNCPYYVTNSTLHTDLDIPYVTEVARRHYRNFHDKLLGHNNPLIDQLSSRSLPDNPVRRLKRKLPRDLLDDSD